MALFEGIFLSVCFTIGAVCGSGHSSSLSGVESNRNFSFLRSEDDLSAVPRLMDLTDSNLSHLISCSSGLCYVLIPVWEFPDDWHFVQLGAFLGHTNY
jgi:hypothetical protein